MIWGCFWGAVGIVFRASWQSVEDERERLLAGKPINEDKLLQNLEAAKALIPWSPWKWAKKAFAMSKAWDTHLDQPGSYVYLILSRVTGKTYEGITGLGKLRKIIRRFKEHLFCARALKKLAKFDKRVRHPLSQSMSQMGQTPQVGHPTDGSLAPKQTPDE